MRATFSAFWGVGEGKGGERLIELNIWQLLIGFVAAVLLLKAAVGWVLRRLGVKKVKTKIVFD